METKSPLGKHFIFLVVGSLLFLILFHLPFICGGVAAPREDRRQTLQDMPAVERGLEVLNEAAIKTSAYLAVIEARTRVAFAYMVFVILVFGHYLMDGRKRKPEPLPRRDSERPADLPSGPRQE